MEQKEVREVKDQSKECGICPSGDVTRDQKIIRTSVIGITANVLLALFKALVGVLTHSIAILLDAVNNLSDAGSSLITIIGTRLASKPADRKHPFGHGRTEYLSSSAIAVIILYAGITSFVESVKKILSPEAPEYTGVSLFIIATAVLVKILLGKYYLKVGRSVNSDSLVNSGEDARLDAVISTATILAAAIFLTTGISLEAWLAAGISLFIIKTGINMLQETFSQILGERAQADLAKNIRETVLSFPEVHGVYDLVLHNYGPDSYLGSLHVEVPDTMTIDQLDELDREISGRVYRKYGIILTAIGVYSMNTHDNEAAKIEKQIRDFLSTRPNIIQMHGFHLEEAAKQIRFDIVVSFDAKDREAEYREVLTELKTLCPGYQFEIAMDTDFSES